MTCLPNTNTLDNIAGNKIKGNNNQIIIQSSQMPVGMCAEMLKARENEMNQLRIENELLRLHIDHLAQDISRVRNILNDKDKYIAALISKILPAPFT